MQHDQTRLFRLAVEAGTIHFRHQPGKGWLLVIGLRRGDESWDEATRDLYEGLSTPELADVIGAVLDRALGL